MIALNMTELIRTHWPLPPPTRMAARMRNLRRGIACTVERLHETDTRTTSWSPHSLPPQVSGLPPRAERPLLAKSPPHCRVPPSPHRASSLQMPRRRCGTPVSPPFAADAVQGRNSLAAVGLSVLGPSGHSDMLWAVRRPSW